MTAPEVYRIVMGGHRRPGAYERPPLSMNDRMHWAKERTIKRALREQVVMACRALQIPTGAKHVKVELFYRPATRNYPDADNLMKTVKTIADALEPSKAAYIDARRKIHPAVLGYGLIPEDTNEHCTRPSPVVIASEGKEKAIWWVMLTVTR